MTMADILARYRPLFEADGVDGVSVTPPDPAADPPVDPGVVIPPVEPPIAAATPPEPNKSAQDWRDKEIKRKHAQLKEREAENTRLREMLDAATRPKTPADPAAPPAEPVRTAAAEPQVEEARIERRAQELASARTLEDQLNAAVATAKAKHGDKWDAAYNNLQTLGGFDPDTLAGIAATDDPSKVLFELGSDPAQYQRVMDLPPHRRLNELAKLGAKAAEPGPAPKKISDAPPPVEPIGGNNNSGAPKFSLQDKEIAWGSWQASPFENQRMDSDANDDRWFAERLAQKRASKGRPWSANQ